jgi:hypothetical protein
MHLHAHRARPLSLTLLAVVSPLALACSDSEPTGSNSPPVVEITTPVTDTGTDNLDYTYDGHDDALNLWYKDVLLEGSGTDAEDGSLSGGDLVWVTDRTDLQDAALGTGGSLTVRLYSDQCTGTWHDVTLTATDSDGESRTAMRQIFIWTLC